MMEEKTILVVDDSTDFLILLTALLKFHKIKVDGVTGPEEAFPLCEAKKYSLIISDYMMETTNGLEFCEKVRSGGINKETPMMLITSKNLEADELNILSALSLTYIRKPVMPNELYRKITDMLGRSA